jgi:hypothetical protein
MMSATTIEFAMVLEMQRHEGHYGVLAHLLSFRPRSSFGIRVEARDYLAFAPHQHNIAGELVAFRNPVTRSFLTPGTSERFDVAGQLAINRHFTH